MHLKAALICEGCTVFDPKKINDLDKSVKLKPSDCAWGHNLVKLARQLAKRWFHERVFDKFPWWNGI